MANQSWWSTERSGAASFDVGQTMSASASCSTPEHADQSHSIAGGFHWPNAGDLFDAKSSSCDESPISISNSSVTFQEIQNPHVSAPQMLLVDAAPQALDFGLSSPSTEWSTQTNFFSGSNTGLRTENSFQVLFQEDTTLGQLKDMNRSNLLHDNIRGSSSDAINSVQLISASVLLQQGLSEPINNMKSNNSLNYNRGVLYESQPQLAKGLLAPVTSVTEARSNLQHARPSQQLLQDETQSYSNNLIICMVRKESSGLGTCFTPLEKKTGSGPANKKPRLGASSSLPTFKVRKEKLGDRITALQQLVSPFGKTDTASVLHEAIEYIKFLHDQVRVSCASYLKSGQQMHQSLDKPKNSQGQEQDLKSRGLCLVPVSSTFAVANDVPTDFLTPFVGSFR